MKAVVVTGYGGAEKLELREVPDPEPARGQVLVRVAAASVNPVDFKLRRGELRERIELEFPAILGRDMAGEVLATGEGVTAFRAGERVMGLVGNCYAELVAADAEALVAVPQGLDLQSAAALPLVGLTGAQLVEEAVDARPGQTILVTGAVGSVGRVAVFAAMARGADVIAGVRARQRGEAEKLGTRRTVAIDEPAEVRRLEMVDAIADTVGGETLQRLLPKLRPSGVLGSVVGVPEEASKRGQRARSMLTHQDPARLAALARSLLEGELVLPIGRRLPLSDARAAHELAETGGVQKIVLLPAEPAA